MPDFGILQRHLDPRERSNLERLDAAPMLVYYPFDLVHLDGRSLAGLPLRRRKSLLERAVIPGDRVKLVDYVAAEGEMFFEAVTCMGLEGMVAKRADSMYEPVARSASWIKVKAIKSQEFLVGGYTTGEGPEPVPSARYCWATSKMEPSSMRAGSAAASTAKLWRRYRSSWPLSMWMGRHSPTASRSTSAARHGYGPSWLPTQNSRSGPTMPVSGRLCS